MLKRLSPAQWLCLALAVILAALAPVVYHADMLVSEYNELLIGAHTSGIGMLTEDSPAAQTFRATQNNLYAVDVMASNYNKKVTEGTLTLWLLDEAGNEVARQDYPVSELKNTIYLTLTLNQVDEQSEGKLYTLRASSDCVEQKGVTLRMGPPNSPNGDQVLTMADGSTDEENAINIRICYQLRSYSTMGFASLLLLALCFLSCIPLQGRKESRHA